MSTATSRELIEQAIEATNRRANALVEQARQRQQRDRERRAEFAAARNRGVARRHAAKLRQQADRRDTPTAATVNLTDASDRGPGRPPVTGQTPTRARDDNAAMCTGTTPSHAREDRASLGTGPDQDAHRRACTHEQGDDHV